MNKQSGFTLIEILIALVIFAIIGVLAAISLHNVIRSKTALNSQEKGITQLQISMTMLRRDLLQAVNRPIVNASNSTELAFVGGGSQISFTRAGIINPENLFQRTDLQRISYTLQDDNLVRQTWDVLDQSPKSLADTQNLMKTESVLFRFVDQNNKIVNSWPEPPPPKQPDQPNQTTDLPPPMPSAVLVSVTVKGMGTIEGVFPTPSTGAGNATTPVLK